MEDNELKCFNKLRRRPIGEMDDIIKKYNARPHIPDLNRRIISLREFNRTVAPILSMYHWDDLDYVKESNIEWEITF